MPLMSSVREAHVIAVHGIGHKTPLSFADAAMKRLSSALSKRGCTLYSQSVHWGPVLDLVQDRMMAQVKSLGSSNRMVQRISQGALADALSYGHHKEAIHAVFDRAVLRLRADNFVIIGHSLGCLVAADWLRSRTQAKVSKFITTGCNLELFYQGAEDKFLVPPQVNRQGTWFNLFDDDDGLGWPVRGWLPHVKDIEVSVGGPLFRWWAASHGMYWTSRGAIWSEVVPKIILGPSGVAP